MSFTTPTLFEEKSPGAAVFVEETTAGTVVSLLCNTAKQYPYNISIKFEGSNWSYQSVYEYSNRLAKILISKGVKQGDVVGLMLDRSPEMIVGLISILK